jgi:hypothetical protein
MNSEIPHQNYQHLIIMIDFAENLKHSIFLISTNFVSLSVDNICNNVGYIILEECLCLSLAEEGNTPAVHSTPAGALDLVSQRYNLVVTNAKMTTKLYL